MRMVALTVAVALMASPRRRRRRRCPASAIATGITLEHYNWEIDAKRARALLEAR